MSALAANLVVGFLSGGIAGALVGYVLRRLGRVTCVVSEWRPEYFRDKQASEGNRAEKERCKPEEADFYQFSVLLDFFNTKDVDTALRGLCVAYALEDGERIGVSPLFTSKRAARAYKEDDRVTTINLPPNSLVSKKLYGLGNATMTKHVAEKGRIEVFGYYPNKKEFRHRIEPGRDGWSPVAPLDMREARGADRSPIRPTS